MWFKASRCPDEHRSALGQGGQDAAGFGGLSQLQDGRHQKQTPRTRKLNPRCDPWEEPRKIGYIIETWKIGITSIRIYYMS